MKVSKSILACCLGLTISLNVYAESELERLKADVEKLKDQVENASEWKEPKTVAHLAGYADVGFVSVENGQDTFFVGTFSPIFHYMFEDWIMLEAELEFELEENGNTEVALEYLTIDMFINDYTAMVAGKFLSPLGQFRQNLHPSWINKMATAPVGFGHDEAAPNAEIGLMFRGGFPMGQSTGTYAVYAGNGPALEFDGTGTEVEMIETPGLNSNLDDKLTFGGRLGWFKPEWKFDLGLSGAAGEVANIDDPTDPTRDYDAAGADFTWRPGNFDVRGEYIKQEIGDQPASTAQEKGKWEAWYTQIAYRFYPTGWEPVIRYGEYDTPHNSEDSEQLAAGINYWFAANVVTKLNYQSNDNPNSGFEKNDVIVLQLAYGF